ncbi:MAG: HD domain-containing protein [Defluviitaleaceae bacterium]|nr:HD domain-containing protein [Defluviitaleaceae bacterium]
MYRAITLSEIVLKTPKQSHVLFFETIRDLLDEDMVQDLDNYVQHRGTSRLQHSLNVAYYSFCIAKALRRDYRTATRGALLHDLYCTDWRKEGLTGWQHAIGHPKDALANAESITELNKREKDIIVKHMWPLTLTPPKYSESYIVCLADKLCTIREVFKRKE